MDITDDIRTGARPGDLRPLRLVAGGGVHARTGQPAMNIGEAAAAAGVTPKMIRHYERIGLIPPAPRTDSGYRAYRDADVQQLRFIRRARAVGFSTPEIRKLLSLWQDRQRPAREVHRLASAHLAELEARIRELREIAGTLAHLLENCHGDERPDCPILDSLADESGEALPGLGPDGVTRRVDRRRTGV